MTEKPVLLCPTCGEPVDPMATIWVFMQKFYCSEKCVRKRVKR